MTSTYQFSEELVRCTFSNNWSVTVSLPVKHPRTVRKAGAFLSALIYRVVRSGKDCGSGIIHWVCNNTKIQEKPTH